MSSLELEEHCKSCDGKGRGMYPSVDGKNRNYRCTLCDGTGVTVTEHGEKVLNFITKHLRAMLHGELK